MLNWKCFSVAGGVAQRQPGGVGAGDRAVEQPHALVFQVQLELALVADLQNAEVDLLRLEAEARLARTSVGSLSSS